MGYKSGIVLSTDCPGGSLDHAILAVGWGTDATHGDYLIVKNSWGKSWGEQGYIKLQVTEGKQGACGVLLDSTIPFV